MIQKKSESMVEKRWSTSLFFASQTDKVWGIDKPLALNRSFVTALLNSQQPYKWL